MGTIRQVKEKYERAFNALPDTIANVVQQTSDVLIDLNRDQLLQGRDADGELLKPTYTEDPYFSTEAATRMWPRLTPRERADKYYKMKKDWEATHKARMTYVELYGQKPDNVPNLLITGNWFFNFFFVNVTKEAYTLGSTGYVADDIKQKYPRVFGIAPKSAEFYYFSFIRPAIERLYKQ